MILTKILDVIAPYSCMICRQSGKLLCQKCMNEFELHKPFCYICKNANNNFELHKYHNLSIRQILVPFMYSDDMSKLIKNGKYYNKKKIFNVLSHQIIPFIKLNLKGVYGDYLIIPVPLSFWRRFKRGYNQSSIIGKTLSKELAIEYSDAVKRIKNTIPQSKLSKEKRFLNVKDAFSLKKDINIQGKHILLVDDVISTGATIFEITELLLKSGAKKISVIALASEKV